MQTRTARPRLRLLRPHRRFPANNVVRPDHLYFLCMMLIVMPLLPFSRTAAVVGLAWLPGQFVYLVSLDPRLVDMGVSLMALAAALRIAANDRDRAIGLLYLATFCVHFSAAVGNTPAWDAYWLDYGLAMMRLALLPFTIDFEAVRDVFAAFKRRRELDELTWRRLLCWHAA